MLLHAFYGESQPVMASQCSGNTYAELMTAGVSRHFADIATDEQHGIATIAHEGAMVVLGFRGATIDNCYKIRSYDDSVLAFLVGVFRYDALLENFHF